MAAMVLNAVPILELGSRTFGGLVMLVGVGLALWAGMGFRTRHTPIHPGHTPTALITTGAFSINRNPIYTGMVLITLGIGLSQGSLLGILPAVALWYGLDRHFAAPEEAKLIETFGDEGRAYVEKVRRW
ncbi:hypothetical protein ATO11_01785 [Pseudaestuariivita atlantica]|uniref:Isoprenylcysteine carboxyl methyltransferase n=1 Tax=Pseudaestuariivita atlantica TaxID=1317121 RepID=A0A0L1JVE6_9RHOB|nr:hypothetical protein ATO11_01785 [Pseudaestuariivita atlantica]